MTALPFSVRHLVFYRWSHFWFRLHPRYVSVLTVSSVSLILHFCDLLTIRILVVSQINFMFLSFTDFLQTVHEYLQTICTISYQDSVIGIYLMVNVLTVNLIAIFHSAQNSLLTYRNVVWYISKAFVKSTNILLRISKKSTNPNHQSLH